MTAHRENNRPRRERLGFFTPTAADGGDSQIDALGDVLYALTPAAAIQIV